MVVILFYDMPVQLTCYSYLGGEVNVGMEGMFKQDCAFSVMVFDAVNGEAMDGVLVEDDNEPTMGEKLAILNLQDIDKTESPEKQESPPLAKPPSADSVNVILKQALHAEDRALLLDCLYNQDEKVGLSLSLSLSVKDEVCHEKAFLHMLPRCVIRAI